MKKQLVSLGFYGHSNSGKTTVITQLISWFSKQGYRVSAIKKTDKTLSIDTHGKDTYRFSEAGADPVFFITKNETTMKKKQIIPIPDIVTSLLEEESLDLLFIEGANEPCIEKIRFGDIPIRENTIYTYKNDLDDLRDFIQYKLEQRNKKMSEQVEIIVNEKKIPLSEFPKEFITHTIKGMVETLKGVEMPITSITITIKTDSE